MSKEDVLKLNDLRTFDEYNPVFENIKRSMDEYAKEIAIGFLIDTIGESFEYNAEQLYNKYLKTIQP